MWIIYMHTCFKTQKSYIGFTRKDMFVRWQEHVRSARRSSRLYFHCAIRAHGEDCWEHVILEEGIATRKLAGEREQYWIAIHRTFGEFGYNLTSGGEGSKDHSYAHTKKAKEKIVNALTGRPVSEQTRSKISIANKGKKRTPEQCLTISIAHKGQTPSDETRQKLSLANTGKKRTDETKQKIGNANRGRVHSEQSRKNMSTAHLGVKPTHETRLKKSKKMLGHKISEETRQKIANANKNRIHSKEICDKMSKSAKRKYKLRRAAKRFLISLKINDIGYISVSTQLSKTYYSKYDT